MAQVDKYASRHGLCTKTYHVFRIIAILLLLGGKRIGEYRWNEAAQI